MDPGVVSHGPGRCGVCNMALVRRKRGDAVMLPDGVVARMQLSPYRVQLAGIRTAPLGYHPMNREWSALGLLSREGDVAATVEAGGARATGSWIEEGQTVEVSMRRAAWPGATLRAGSGRSCVALTTDVSSRKPSSRWRSRHRCYAVVWSSR